MRTAVTEPDIAHRTYKVWAGMKARCQCKNNPNYKNYGARGIKVCAAWQTYGGFIADMGYAPYKLTIDRLNNDGNYEPGNCKWATMQEQANNRRNNKTIVVDGVSKTLSELATENGIKPHTLAKRIRKGWAVDLALSLNPSDSAHYKKLIEFGGESLGLTKWAARIGIPKSTLKTRLARGWSIERALSNV